MDTGSDQMEFAGDFIKNLFGLTNSIEIRKVEL